MNHPAFTPLRNNSLPREFRYNRLERARDHDHPEGDSNIAYISIAPPDAASRIDGAIWRERKEACRVIGKLSRRHDDLGHLVDSSGKSWRFHYDVSRDTSDESGYHFGGENMSPANIYRSMKLTE